MRRNLFYKVMLLHMALALILGSAMAYAQNYQEMPEIEVDMGVLHEMEQQRYKPQQLSRPTQDRPRRAALTAPEVTNTPYQPVQSVRPIPLKQAVVPRIELPVQSRPKPIKPAKLIPSSLSPDPTKIYAKPKPPEARVTKFPIQTNSRTDSSDPSLRPYKPSTPDRPAIKRAEKNTDRMNAQINTMIPLPTAVKARVKSVGKKIFPQSPSSQDPFPVHKPPLKSFKKQSLLQTPPIPKRRPVIRRASQEFVRKARQEIQRQQHHQIKKGKKDGPAVAAVPAVRVAAEPLHSAARQSLKHDPLGRQLLEPDRKSLLESIQTIANQTAADKKPARTAKMTAMAKHVPLPKQKPRFAQKPSYSVATIEPAAGTEKKEAHNKRNTPRPPPSQGSHEQEFISVAFPAALNELNDDIAEALDGRILPLLDDNPHWRIQIQAFASPPDNGLSSARRASLSRALSIRSWLLDQGIEARRMDVRALGMQTDRDPVDRVDLVFFDPHKK